MIYLMKKYERKNSYRTPWGLFPCIIENGLAILPVPNKNMTKYLINRYGFKVYKGYVPKKEETVVPKKVVPKKVVQKKVVQKKEEKVDPKKVSSRGSNGRFEKKATTKKAAPKKTARRKTIGRAERLSRIEKE